MSAGDTTRPTEGQTLLKGWREEPALLLSIFAANAIAYLPTLLLPWLIGALVEHQGYSASGAGLLASAQQACLAASAALTALCIHRFERRLIILLGAAMGLLSTLVLLFGSPGLLMIALPLSGIGFGLCSAGGNALIAASRDPARLNARVWALMLPWQMIIWAAAPVLSARYGLDGLFELQAAGMVVMMILLLCASSRAEGLQNYIPAQSLPTAKLRLPPGLVVLIIGCTAAFWLRDSTTWSLVERRAVMLDIDSAVLSVVLSVGTVIGLAGSAATIWLGLRFGRLRMVTLSQLLSAFVLLSIALVETPLLYCGAFLFWSASSVFAWNYIIEMSAALDSSGRMTAICGGLVFGAGALGPLLGGVALDSSAGTALPLLIGSLSAVAVTFACVLAYRLGNGMADTPERPI